MLPCEGLIAKLTCLCLRPIQPPCIGIVLAHPARNTIRLLCSSLQSSQCRIWLHKGERIHSVGFCSAFATGTGPACVRDERFVSECRTNRPTSSRATPTLGSFAIEKVSSTRNQSWECGPVSYCSWPSSPILRAFVIKKVSSTGTSYMPLLRKCQAPPDCRPTSSLPIPTLKSLAQ